MSVPAIGDAAPDFELPDADGVPFRLSSMRGQAVVFYFYPEDDTEGCTMENRAFSALQPQFTALGAKVVGISPDTIESHCHFRDKFGLGVTLLADPRHLAIEAYGVWGPKVTFGHHLVGLIRSTFLVAPNGRVAATWRVTRIRGHAEKVLEATQALGAG